MGRGTEWLTHFHEFTARWGHGARGQAQVGGGSRRRGDDEEQQGVSEWSELGVAGGGACLTELEGVYALAGSTGRVGTSRG